MQKIECWKCSNPECHCHYFTATYTVKQYRTFDPLENNADIDDEHTLDGPFDVRCAGCGKSADWEEMTIDEYEKFFGILIPSYMKKEPQICNKPKEPSTELVYNSPFEVE